MPKKIGGKRGTYKGINGAPSGCPAKDLTFPLGLGEPLKVLEQRTYMITSRV